MPFDGHIASEAKPWRPPVNRADRRAVQKRMRSLSRRVDREMKRRHPKEAGHGE